VTGLQGPARGGAQEVPRPTPTGATGPGPPGFRAPWPSRTPAVALGGLL